MAENEDRSNMMTKLEWGVIIRLRIVGTGH